MDGLNPAPLKNHGKAQFVDISGIIKWFLSGDAKWISSIHSIHIHDPKMMIPHTNEDGFHHGLVMRRGFCPSAVCPCKKPTRAKKHIFVRHAHLLLVSLKKDPPKRHVSSKTDSMSRPGF